MAGGAARLDAEVLDRAEDVIREVSTVIDAGAEDAGAGRQLSASESVEREDAELLELIRRYQTPAQAAGAGAHEEEAGEARGAEPADAQGDPADDPGAQGGTVVASSYRSVTSRSTRRAGPSSVRFQEFSFETSSIDKAISHYQRSREEDLLVRRSIGAGEEDDRAAAAAARRAKSPIKSTAKFHARKPQDLARLLAAAEKDAAAKSGRPAASAAPGRPPRPQSGARPAQQLTAATRYSGSGGGASSSSGPGAYGSQAGIVMRRFEKRRMDFASAYADEMAEIVLQEAQQQTRRQRSRRGAPGAPAAAAASQEQAQQQQEEEEEERTRVSLEYVNELEEQLRQLKRSVEKDGEGGDALAAAIRAQRRTQQSGEAAAEGDRAPPTSGVAGPPRDSAGGEEEEDVRAAASPGGSPGGPPAGGGAARPPRGGGGAVSSRYKVSSVAEVEASEADAAETGASLGALMSKYREAEDGSAMTETSRRFFETKRSEYSEDLALVESRLGAAGAGPPGGDGPGDGGDVWAATHSDDESAYRRSCRAAAPGGSLEEPMEVHVEAAYHSDSEAELASSRGDYCYDVSVVELQRYFEERRAREERQAEVRRQLLEQRRRRQQQQRRRRDRYHEKEASGAAGRREEEYYDPHENCCKFLGPRSQHGDGLPAPDFPGRRRADRAQSSSRGFTSSAGKKKSIMQAKMEQVRSVPPRAHPSTPRASRRRLTPPPLARARAGPGAEAAGGGRDHQPPLQGEPHPQEHLRAQVHPVHRRGGQQAPQPGGRAQGDAREHEPVVHAAERARGGPAPGAAAGRGGRARC